MTLKCNSPPPPPVIYPVVYPVIYPVVYPVIYPVVYPVIYPVSCRIIQGRSGHREVSRGVGKIISLYMCSVADIRGGGVSGRTPTNGHNPTSREHSSPGHSSSPTFFIPLPTIWACKPN